jgi:hypothetical protein
MNGRLVGVQELAHLRGQLRRAWRGVFHLLVALREAPEVVHHRPGRGGDEGERRFLPMGGATRIAVGFAKRADQSASWRVQVASSARGGAPWLR